MKTISARDANHRFSKVLDSAERGESVVITRHGRPVALLSPHRTTATKSARGAALKRMASGMKQGLPWPERGPFGRDDMHER